MIKINKFSKIRVLAVLLIGFVAASVYGQAADFKPIADEMIGSSSITWSPKMNYAKLVLTISRPDGTVFHRTFDSGITPYAELSSILGKNSSDGSYTYELRVIPVTERRYRDTGSNDSSFLSGTQASENLTRKALTQTGAFRVQGGMIVSDDVPEPGSTSSGVSNTTGTVVYSGGSNQGGISFPQDQVIADDLIVTGSVCVGFDCVNNENFGFDTLRLKENNLRIKFEDTSNSGSFPSTDWQLTANDSTNGGLNKFSIEDISAARVPFTIEGSAPSNSIYVDDGGRVGFGTSTPVLDLHVTSGNTPSLRLEQDGSSGFTPQTWDVAGNETNFFVRDVTNGSQLPFRIKPGADTNSLFIDSDNDIGMGTQSPGGTTNVSDTAVRLHLYKSNGNVKLALENASGAAAVFTAAGTQTHIGSITDHEFRFYVNNDWRMRLNPTSNTKILEMRLGSGGGAYSDGTDWFPSSSRELKENINNLTVDEAIEALDRLIPVKYNYKSNKEEARVGFIAEDVPELVAINGRKHLNSMDIVAVLTKVVQKQQKIMQEHQKTIAQLKKEIAELKKK
jgi:hypothetical protein